MSPTISLVITSIAGQDNAVLRSYAESCSQKNITFILIGDTRSPASFQLDGCDFYSLAEQRKLPFQSASFVPEKHYARKNIGYLIAIRNGAEVIIETDDDNYALPAFWEERKKASASYLLEDKGWVNLYGYFTKQRIWPRGFALEHLHDALPALDASTFKSYTSPIQQGLANENPDVDAIYRLILPLPVSFNANDNVAIGRGSWCPFNSQNTTWLKEAFMLLYLPAYCSFRMTDIWRSFVAQRICWENNWPVLFHKATVWQERNEHNLMRDFADEIPGYTHNKKITDALAGLHLSPGAENIADNLLKCYEVLAGMGLVGQQELPLLKAWIADMQALQ